MMSLLMSSRTPTHDLSATMPSTNFRLWPLGYRGHSGSEWRKGGIQFPPPAAKYPSINNEKPTSAVIKAHTAVFLELFFASVKFEMNVTRCHSSVFRRDGQDAQCHLLI
ncbi:hypothetical protein TNCV_280021 [Trichonephila clavipes]|nr:hypothetical protein TNCV_280021 [Trichonephila clavipes]